MPRAFKVPNRHVIKYVSPQSLRPYAGNARTHSEKQIRALQASIRQFGYTQPALVTRDREIIAGHGRVEAAKKIGLSKIPVIRIEHLSDIDRRAYILADNQLALKAGWDRETLANELQNLIEVGFDLDIAGFDAPEVDLLLEITDQTRRDPDIEDASPDPASDQPAVTRPGDIWLLGSKTPHQHKLICGNSRDCATVSFLLPEDVVGLMNLRRMRQ